MTATDYAYVPPYPESPDFSDGYKILFELKPDANVVPHDANVADDAVTNVAAFITHVDQNVSGPIGDLILVGHGIDRAEVYIGLDDDSGQMLTTFEDVERAAASGSVVLPSSLSGTTVRFRGCRIGRAGPMMTQLKQAFGGTAQVIAPNHYMRVVANPNLGALEYMLYADWRLVTASEIKPEGGRSTRDVIVGMFRDRPYQYYNGEEVPDDYWEEAIPQRLPKPRSKEPFGVAVDFGAIEGMSSRRIVDGEFRHYVTPFEIWVDSLPTDTKDQSAIRSFLGSNLPYYAANYAEYAPLNDGHPYPVFERWGYTDLSTMLAGLTWTYSASKGGVHLFTGSRHEYSLLAPIEDRTTGLLLYNHYPKSSSAMPQETLNESHAGLFTTV